MHRRPNSPKQIPGTPAEDAENPINTPYNTVRCRGLIYRACIFGQPSRTVKVHGPCARGPQFKSQRHQECISIFRDSVGNRPRPGEVM